VNIVKAAHDKHYRTSLAAGARIRPDGKTEEQWRMLLNHARDTLIDTNKRAEHIAMLRNDNQDLEAVTLPLSDLTDFDTTRQGLSYYTIPDDVEIPDGMVYIPEGEFQMGSDDEEANDDEQPVHTVYLDAFLMDRYPVTNAEFKAFLNANIQTMRPEWLKESNKKTYFVKELLRYWHNGMFPYGKDDHPIIGVSWYAAMIYAEWSGKRLPTEAEWEKAARGGLVGKKYPWGDSIDSDTIESAYEVESTVAVGLSNVNGYGLYDISGNVWEWCLDAYSAMFYANSPQQNPISGINTVEWVASNYDQVNSPRVLRGGPWGTESKGVRVSHRFSSNPIDTLPTFGFRCVKRIP